MGDNSGVDRMYQLVAPRTLPCDDANIEIQYSTRFWIMPNAVTQDRFGRINEEQGVIVGHAGEQIPYAGRFTNIASYQMFRSYGRNSLHCPCVSCHQRSMS